MTKSRNLFKNVSIFFCLIPMLLLSILCLVPQSKYDTYADYTVSDFTFVGSNIITTSTHFKASTTTFQPWHFTNWQSTLYYSSTNGYSVTITGICMAHLNASNFGDPFSISGSSSSLNVDSLLTNTGGNPVLAFLSGETDYYVIFRVWVVGQFNGNVVKIVYDNYDFGSSINNRIFYYDDNNNFYAVSIGSYYGTNTTTKSLLQNLALTPRTYYTDVDLSNNGYYQSGYADGYDTGLSDGSSGGYADGYDAGVIDGYNNGYNAGLTSSNNYSFLSLLGAVIDAPVSAFTSLLNFELLGFNMLAFFTGLLTLALIMFIVKLILGGK